MRIYTYIYIKIQFFVIKIWKSKVQSLRRRSSSSSASESPDEDVIHFELSSGVHTLPDSKWMDTGTLLLFKRFMKALWVSPFCWSKVPSRRSARLGRCWWMRGVTLQSGSKLISRVTLVAGSGLNTFWRDLDLANCALRSAAKAQKV